MWIHYYKCCTRLSFNRNVKTDSLKKKNIIFICKQKKCKVHNYLTDTAQKCFLLKQLLLFPVSKATQINAKIRTKTIRKLTEHVKYRLIYCQSFFSTFTHGVRRSYALTASQIYEINATLFVYCYAMRQTIQLFFIVWKRKFINLS